MNSSSFLFRNAARMAVLAFICCSVFCIPQRVNAQVSAEAEKALLEARIRVIRDWQDPIDFNLPLLGGGSAAVSSFKGKVVILNFWATWCPPCRAEMPSMENLYRRYKSRGLEILAVDSGEERETARQFIQNNKYTFPVLLDENGKVSTQYGISAIPTSFIIDRNGKIITVIRGSINWDDPKIITAFDKLLTSR